MANRFAQGTMIVLMYAFACKVVPHVLQAILRQTCPCSAGLIGTSQQLRLYSYHVEAQTDAIDLQMPRPDTLIQPHQMIGNLSR